MAAVRIQLSHSLMVVSLLVVALCPYTSNAMVVGHPLSKRSFFDIQCKGVYDKAIFARLDRICDDCFNLYREPQLPSLCRSSCFNNPYFKGCLDALLLTEENGEFDRMIDILGRRK